MDFEDMILDLAEDDYTGLWELIWRARTTMADDRAGDLLERLRSELETLIQERKVSLFRGTKFTGEEQPISAADVPVLLATPGAWEPPAIDEPHLRVLAT